MSSRKHVHEETFLVVPKRLFALLHTPSAIRQWWGADRAIILPEPGGYWVAAWGASEDDPDYVTVATIQEFNPPHRMVLADYRYHAPNDPLPFEAGFVTAFDVAPHPEGATLRIEQEGFPSGPEGDAFYAACETGWRDTFAGIRRFLSARSERLSVQ